MWPMSAQVRRGQSTFHACTAAVEKADVKPCRTRCGISLGANPILLESLEGRTLCRRAACKMFLAQIT